MDLCHWSAGTKFYSLNVKEGNSLLGERIYSDYCFIELNSAQIPLCSVQIIDSIWVKMSLEEEWNIT